MLRSLAAKYSTLELPSQKFYAWRQALHNIWTWQKATVWCQYLNLSINCVVFQGNIFSQYYRRETNLSKLHMSGIPENKDASFIFPSSFHKLLYIFTVKFYSFTPWCKVPWEYLASNLSVLNKLSVTCGTWYSFLSPTVGITFVIINH